MKCSPQLISLAWILPLLFQSSYPFVEAIDIPTPTSNGQGDICDSDAQCENGGVCAEPNANHPHKYCHCAEGFVGIHCSSFCPLQCKNGGYCQYHQMAEPHQFKQDRDPADYICQCFGLFEGKTCEIPYMNCGDGRRCYNGGSCRQIPSLSGGIGTICDCPRGFGGPACQDEHLDPIPNTKHDDEDNSVDYDSGRREFRMAFGIPFSILFLFLWMRYCTTWCRGDEYVVISYGDEIDDGEEDDDAISMTMPKWKHVV